VEILGIWKIETPLCGCENDVVKWSIPEKTLNYFEVLLGSVIESIGRYIIKVKDTAKF